MLNSAIEKKLEDIKNETVFENKKQKVADLLLTTDFLKDQDMLVLFDYMDNQANPLLRFFQYRNDKKQYNGVDVDVSLGSMIVYSLLCDYLKDSKITPQTSAPKKYEAFVDGISYRGDTMTSIWTVLKQYLNEIGFSSSASAEYKNLFEFTRNKICVPAKLSNQYKGVNDYVHINMCKEKDFFDSIYSEVKKSKSLINFLEVAFCIGNYIEMPININAPRSHGGRWDTTDRLLWKIYQYYKLEKDVTYLESLFDRCKKIDTLDNCIKWLKKSNGWDDFIDKHCLQDFVEQLPDGTFGRPICLKKGTMIACNIVDLSYEPMPNTINECEMFFKNVSERIVLRSRRIQEKIQINLRK